MRIRKKLKYPPYYNICLIKLVGKDYNILYEEGLKIKKYLCDDNIIILGPSLAAIPKIYNKYHMQIIIKYKNLKDIYNKLKFILDKCKILKTLSIEIDMNPKKI